MPQVIKIKRGTTVPANGTLTEGELGLLMTAPGNLYAGDAAAATLPLVTPLRQVELAGVQTITGAKTIDVANLKVTGGAAAGDLLTTTDPATGVLAFVTPAVSAVTDWAEDADMDAATPVANEFVNPANVRVLVGGQMATLNTLDKTAVIPAINSLKAEVDLLATGAKFVGTFDAAAATADFTTASGLTDGPLPAATAVPVGAYVINEVAGTDPAGAPTGDYGPGDWLISDGATWTHLDFSAAAGGTVLASGVTVSPLVNGGDDVQEVLASLDADITAIETALPLTYEPIITGTTAADLWTGAKTWVAATALPPTTAQIAIDAGQDTIIAGKEPALPAGGLVTDYLNGLKAWVPMPAPVDITTKADITYVDAQNALDVKIAGSTMTGLLILSGDAVAATGAVTLQQLTASNAAQDTANALAYEPIIAPPTTPVATQYWSGLKTWLDLPPGAAPPVADQISIVGDGTSALPFTVALVDAGTY